MAKLAINGGPKAAEALNVPAWPMVTKRDEEAVLEAVRSGKWCRIYPGSRVEKFEKAYAEFHDAKHAIAVSNGTVAIELALLTAGVRPGDHVMVPAVTFIASASAIVRVGAAPIFVDSDPDTAQINPKAVKAAITPRTKAIVGVHYGGYPIDFDAILPICEKRGIALIEDCAHAQGTEWKERKVGAIGRLGSFSFQASKALSGGEGGVVLTDDAELAEKARLLHNIGRVVGKPGYEHYVNASNYRMSELHGALLLSQLERLPEQTNHKHEQGEFLARELAKIGGVDPMKRDKRITRRGYYFFILKYDARQFKELPRNKFIAALNAEGVPCHAAYMMPLYKQPAFVTDNVRPFLSKDCEPLPEFEKLNLPVAEKFCAEQQVTIPHPVLLADRRGIQSVIDAVAKIKENVDELR
ncbi:MAG: DegT/DnrJ/EryC1/StrS family aminotransferase [Planctomycetota bacterium]